MTICPPPLNHIAELEGAVHRRHVCAGGTLFLEGEHPRTLYQVVKGVAKMVRTSVDGREVITELVFPGEICDLLECMDGIPSLVSGKALQQHDLEVLAVPRDRVLSHPILSAACEEACHEKMRLDREMLVSLAVERVEQRAIRVLLLLAQHLGQATPAGIRFQLPLTRQELSEVIGATLETTIRVLSKLRKAGMVTERGGWMILSPRLELDALCGAA